MILDEIIQTRKQTIKSLKKQTTIADLKQQITETSYPRYSFYDALTSKIRDLSPHNHSKIRDLSPYNNSKIREVSPKIIAEVKRASPSRGMICEVFDYVRIAKDYEAGGASAISVLTEPVYFKGENRHLTEIKEAVKLPLLRKDFIVDEWQIYEAKAIGADAILLIVAALEQRELEEFLNLAHALEMDVLVETHNEEEVERAIAAKARIIGVNNRDLQTFEVSLKVSERLSKLIPKACIFVAESGVKTLEDMKFIKSIGADAVLIGEGVVKEGNRVERLKEFVLI